MDENEEAVIAAQEDPESPTDETVTARPRSGRGWRVVSMSLVILVALLAPVAVDALWVRRTVLDTDAFMTQVSPMVEDPDVQQAVIEQLDRSLADANVEERVAKRLPDNLQFLAAPVASGVETVVHEAAERVVTSDEFAKLFNDALRLAHDKLVTVLTGEGEYVKVDQGVVTVDLTSVRNKVVERIKDSRIGSFIPLKPDKPVEIKIADSPALAKAQTLLRVLKSLGYIIPFVLIVLIAAAIATAMDRRRAVIRLSVGVTIMMIIHLIALAIGRSFYLDAVSGALDLPATGSLYDLLVKFPRVGTRSILILALLTWAGAALAGPSRGAQRVRATIGSLTGRSGGAVADLGPIGTVGAWVAAHHRAVQGTMIAGAGLVLASLGRLTPRGVVWTAVGLIVVLLIVEVLAAAGRVAPEADDVVEAT